MWLPQFIIFVVVFQKLWDFSAILTRQRASFSMRLHSLAEKKTETSSYLERIATLGADSNSK